MMNFTLLYFVYIYVYVYNYTYIYIYIYIDVFISITIYIYISVNIKIYRELFTYTFVAITSVLVDSRPLGLSSTNESPEHPRDCEVSTVGRHHKKRCVRRRQCFYGGNWKDLDGFLLCSYIPSFFGGWDICVILNLYQTKDSILLYSEIRCVNTFLESIH